MIPQLDSKTISRNYKYARDAYAQSGVDTDAVLQTLRSVPLSLHCWQGDDVRGFENPEGELTGGIQATGNYPGRAHTPMELRADIAKALSLIPGRHRVSVHALYADYAGPRVNRNELAPQHFANWMEWAGTNQVGLDFNSTFFSHPKADDGWTLASADKGIRQFWVEHGIACRKIAAAMGKSQGSPCIHNVWIPDGEKDLPADRWSPRERLRESLDRIFAEEISLEIVKDSVESKLFGIGSESYVVGSFEFYLSYAIRKNKLLCLDTGHFHPTEVVSDKISAVLTFLDEILLHISRGIRWDSDHVVVLSDEVCAIAEEIVRGDALRRVHIGLDYFDASINRVAAWVIGARAVIKAVLLALLQPTTMLKQAEAAGDRTRRLALMEDLKAMPSGAVWDYYCETQGVPPRASWLNEVRRYEETVLSRR